MARIALAMGSGHLPADLGPCARAHVEPAAVRAALAAAGHLLVDGEPDLTVADVAAAAPAPAGPLVLVSFDRPLDPWRAIADPHDRQAFIDPWEDDLAARKRAALGRRADAYADTIQDLVAGIDLALARPVPDPPALHYLGALFNACHLRPGTRFALDAEPRPLVLGRGQGADVHLFSPQVARAHLQLAVTDEDGLAVTDLAGTNGTWLRQPDGEVAALAPGVRVHAHPGALIMPEGSFRFLVA